jgi:hypothetical protein
MKDYLVLAISCTSASVMRSVRSDADEDEEVERNTVRGVGFCDRHVLLLLSWSGGNRIKRCEFKMLLDGTMQTILSV